MSRLSPTTGHILSQSELATETGPVKYLSEVVIRNNLGQTSDETENDPLKYKV